MPKGPLGKAPPAARRRFLTGHEATEGVGLSRRNGADTILEKADMRASNWLPGTLERIYGDADPTRIAVREHVGRIAGVHPSRVIPEDDGARSEVEPLTRYPIRVDDDAARVRVADTGAPILDIAPVRDFWRRRLNCGPWGRRGRRPAVDRALRPAGPADRSGWFCPRRRHAGAVRRQPPDRHRIAAVLHRRGGAGPTPHRHHRQERTTARPGSAA